MTKARVYVGAMGVRRAGVFRSGIRLRTPLASLTIGATCPVTAIGCPPLAQPEMREAIGGEGLVVGFAEFADDQASCRRAG